MPSKSGFVFRLTIPQAAFFPAIHYIFGAWYRGDEIARRGGVFYVGLTLGTLTAGLIQAGASSSLDGVNGLAGWYVSPPKGWYSTILDQDDG